MLERNLHGELWLLLAWSLILWIYFSLYSLFISETQLEIENSNSKRYYFLEECQKKRAV